MKAEAKQKKSYQGGGVNVTKKVQLKHTKKGNRLFVSTEVRCLFKASGGGNQSYTKYNCESHCKMFIEKYQSGYYLFGS